LRVRVSDTFIFFTPFRGALSSSAWPSSSSGSVTPADADTDADADADGAPADADAAADDS
jgi:hypothetical protein